MGNVFEDMENLKISDNLFANIRYFVDGNLDEEVRTCMIFKPPECQTYSWLSASFWSANLSQGALKV